MANVNVFKWIVYMIVLMSIVVTGEEISCGQVATSLGPCIPYLTSSSGCQVPKACCSGVQSLNQAARSKSDRQGACRCLKSAAGGIKGLNLNKAAGLPKRCRVNIPHKISPSTDCNNVQ